MFRSKALSSRSVVQVTPRSWPGCICILLPFRDGPRWTLGDASFPHPPPRTAPTLVDPVVTSKPHTSCFRGAKSHKSPARRRADSGRRSCEPRTLVPQLIRNRNCLLRGCLRRTGSKGRGSRRNLTWRGWVGFFWIIPRHRRPKGDHRTRTLSIHRRYSHRCGQAELRLELTGHTPDGASPPPVTRDDPKEPRCMLTQHGPNNPPPQSPSSGAARTGQQQTG